MSDWEPPSPPPKPDPPPKSRVERLLKHSKGIIQKLNFKELLYIVVGPPLEAWHWLSDVIYAYLRRKAWTTGRQLSMIRERVGVPEWYSGTGFQRRLFKLNFLKAKRSPQGGIMTSNKAYLMPHPLESQEFWKREEKTKQMTKFFQLYLHFQNISNSQVNSKMRDAYNRREWIPEMEMMKSAPPTRLQINWQRKRMYLSSQVGEYWQSVGSTKALMKETEFYEMVQSYSKKDGGKFINAWITANEKKDLFFKEAKNAVAKSDYLHPAQKEQYRRKVTAFLLNWRNNWNWANPSQFWPWGENNFGDELYTKMTPYSERMKFNFQRFFYYLTGGNRSFYFLDISHALISSHAAKVVALFYSVLALKFYDYCSEKKPWEDVITFFTELDKDPISRKEKEKKGMESQNPNIPVLDPYSFEGEILEQTDSHLATDPLKSLIISKKSNQIKDKILSLRNELNESRYLLVKPWLELKYLEWKYPEFSEFKQKTVQLRRQWEQEDLGNEVYREKKRKERIQSARAFRFNAEHGETAKRVNSYKKIYSDIFSEDYRKEARDFREKEGVPEWPHTADYRNDYYWKIRLKTPFPPGFAGDFLRKLEDENFIRNQFSNPHIYYPQGRPESERDYILSDSLRRRINPELFPNDDVEMPYMVKEHGEASWNTPGVITPVTEDYGIPEITHLRGWRQGGNDHTVHWPNRYDDPVLYTDWRKEPILPAGPGSTKNPAAKWNWDSRIPSSWLQEDMQRLRSYANYTRQMTGHQLIWDSASTPDEEMDDIDTEYYYQLLRNVDNDFEHGIPDFNVNEDPELSEVTNHPQNLRGRTINF